MSSPTLPLVVSDYIKDSDLVVEELLTGVVEFVSLNEAKQSDLNITGMYTYGHPDINGDIMDRYPNLKVISNYGITCYIQLHTYTLFFTLSLLSV